MRNPSYKFIVCDRYIDSTRIFSKALFEQKFLSQFDLDILNNRLDVFLKSNCVPMPKLRFFLDTPIKLCAERIQKRSRSGERSFTTESYLKVVNDCHVSVLGEDANFRKVHSVGDIIALLELDQGTE